MFDNSTRRIHLNEFNEAYDKAHNRVFHSNPHTEIEIRCPETGEVLFHGHNKVVGAGGGLVARKLFDVTNPILVPTYNTELDIPDPGPEDAGAVYDWTAATEDDPKVFAFCVGNDGCGTEGSQIFAVDYNSRISPAGIVPFRYPMLSNDLSDEERKLYFGRKEDGSYVPYYFKRFSSGPNLFEQYLDGTPIDANVYTSGQEYEVFVECILDVAKQDAREFYVATTGLSSARVNSVSLLYGYPRKVGGKDYLMDVRPFTRLNFSNEYLLDLSKGLQIIYHTYF